MKKAFSLILILLCLLPAAALAAFPEPDPPEVIYERALAEYGKPYEWGKAGPDAYDACGFVSYCVSGKHAIIGTVYTFLNWPRVSSPEPGDICVSETGCGIYAGPGSMLYAAGPGASVCFVSIPKGMIYVRYGPAPVPSTGDRAPLSALSLGLLASAVLLGVSFRKRSLFR